MDVKLDIARDELAKLLFSLQQETAAQKQQQKPTPLFPSNTSNIPNHIKSCIFQTNSCQLNKESLEVSHNHNSRDFMKNKNQPKYESGLYYSIVGLSLLVSTAIIIQSFWLC